MSQHHINALRRIHGTLRAIDEKVSAFEGALKGVDVDFVSAVYLNVSQLLALYERAESAGGLGADLFNFGFDSFEGAFDLQMVLNQDWSNAERVASVVRDMVAKMRRDGSPYLRLLDFKRKIADAWADPVVLSNELLNKNKRADEILSDLEKRRQHLNELADDVSRERTIAGQSDHFAKLACQYCRESSGWLWAIGVLSFAGFTLGLYEIFAHHEPVLEGQQLYHLIAGRVILVSVGFYLMRVFSQAFRQSKQNKVINLHRSRSLLAFERIVSAVDDRSSKDIVLAKAADALFSHQSSASDGSQAKGSDSTDVRISVSTDKLTSQPLS
jgi:hypothetical protein